MKDAKVTGKKKRSLSDEEDKPEEKVAAAQKSSKKQKVNQEKEGRKAQKVIIAITNSHTFSFVYVPLNLFW